MRKFLTTAASKFTSKLEKDGMTNVFNMMSLFDDLGHTCYYGIETYVNTDYSTFLSTSGILQNVLYNAGFMFTDVIEIALNNDRTVNEYSYFLAFRVGDFLIRFFYKDSTQI